MVEKSDQSCRSLYVERVTRVSALLIIQSRVLKKQQAHPSYIGLDRRPLSTTNAQCKTQTLTTNHKAGYRNKKIIFRVIVLAFYQTQQEICFKKKFVGAFVCESFSPSFFVVWYPNIALFFLLLHVPCEIVCSVQHISPPQTCGFVDSNYAWNITLIG